MKLLYYLIFLFVNCVINQDNQKNILPFSSIKITEGDIIYFTLDLDRKEWHQLLSIDNTGADAIIKYSKENFGEDNCDYSIECYKYNIIANFDEVYYGLKKKKIPLRISLEYKTEKDNQNGIDVESTVEKNEINLKNIKENIELSKNKVLKGLNKIKKSIAKFFEDDNNKNLVNDIKVIKNEILSLEKKEENIEHVKIKFIILGNYSRLKI